MSIFPDRFRRPFCNFPAEAQNDDLFAQRANKMHVVLDHEERHAAACTNFLKLHLQGFGFHGIQPGRGLVEKQKAWLRHNGAHELNTLLQAVRQVTNSCVLVFA